MESPSPESNQLRFPLLAKPAQLERVLGKILDDDGVPRRMPVREWWGILEELDRLRKFGKEEWPESLRDRVKKLLEMTLRFTRPDGSCVFGGEAPPENRATTLRRWAEFLDDPGIGAISRWWFTRRGKRGEVGPPPLPAYGSETSAFAMLRSNWRVDGDFVGIDHRGATPSTTFELHANGARLLGPSWDANDGATGPAKLTGYGTDPMADWAEWRFPVGTAKVARLAVFLRSRHLAILADEWQGFDGKASQKIALAKDVTVKPIAESRALLLKAPGMSARVIPLGLPSLPYPTERGSFQEEAGHLVLNQNSESKRSWLPLVVSWDKERNRRPITWRVLTVSERSKACPRDVAFAARLSWGPGDGLVVYRSLARPKTRVFLGHQTSSRFMVGLFNETGDVVPLLSLD